MSARKKKLIQWLNDSHTGNPCGAVAFIAGKAGEGSDGKPNNRYCIHATPTVAIMVIMSIISAY